MPIREELYIECERPQYNRVNGRFLKGRKPFNKGKSWRDYMDGRKARKVKRIGLKNLKPRHDIGGNNRKAVILYDRNDHYIRFKSIMDCALYIGCSAALISRCCRNNHPAKGMLVKFYNDMI